MREGMSSETFVAGLDLPDEPGGFRLESADEPPVEFSTSPQAVTIGAQIAEFTPRLDAAQRKAIADSMLIAQLAANKAADSNSEVIAWYRKYSDVLQGIGWGVRELEFQTQQVGSGNAGVHSAIIPVLTAMLGPAVAAGSLVISVLNGLKEMDKDKPWITVFDRASQHAHGAKFQVAYVDADAQGNPEITALCFGVEAARSVTQVLFFKFSQETATLSKANGRFTIDLGQLAQARDAIAARVNPFVQDFVKNIDI